MNARNEDGETALHAAALFGNLARANVIGRGWGRPDGEDRVVGRRCTMRRRQDTSRWCER